MTARPGDAVADAQPPIEVGRVLSESFALLGDRAGLVFGLTLITILPSRLLILALATQGVSLTDPTRSLVTYSLAMLGVTVLASMMGVFGNGALIGAALARRDGKSVGLFETLMPAVRRLPIMLPVGLIHTIAFLVGLMLLLVPGLILGAMWAVVGPILVAEQTGIVATFGRSQELTRHTRWRIFLLMLLTGIGTSLVHWLMDHLGLLLFDSASPELTFAAEPAPFLFETLTLLLTNGFGLAMICTLYIALIERYGDGPVTSRLGEIFA